MATRKRATGEQTERLRLPMQDAGKIAENHRIVGKAVVGTEITLFGNDIAVQAKCAHNDGHWVCLTHDESFANQLQKDIHIGSGVHVLAWVCRPCGNVQVP